MIDNIVEGGMAADFPEICVGMRLTKVAGQPVEKLEDAHYFFGAASWPLSLAFQASASPAVGARGRQDAPRGGGGGRGEVDVTFQQQVRG